MVYHRHRHYHREEIYKWRITVKFIAYFQLIVTVFGGGLAGLTYIDKVFDSSPSPLPPPLPPKRHPGEICHEKILFVAVFFWLFKFYADVQLMRAATPGRLPSIAREMCGPSAFLYFFITFWPLYCLFILFMQEASHVIKNGWEDFGEFLPFIPLILFYGPCYYAVAGFQNELRLNLSQSVGTDPPSPEEERGMLEEKGERENRKLMEDFRRRLQKGPRVSKTDIIGGE